MAKEHRDLIEVLGPFCDCGKPAKSTCGASGQFDGGLIICHKPICESEDHWCDLHRHRSGTMGYPDWLPVSTTWEGFEPDGPGLWEWLKCLKKKFTYNEMRTAQEAWDEQISSFQQRAPLPDLTLRVGKRTFRSFSSTKMYDVTEVKPLNKGIK